MLEQTSGETLEIDNNGLQRKNPLVFLKLLFILFQNFFLVLFIIKPVLTYVQEKKNLLSVQSLYLYYLRKSKHELQH